MVRKVIFKKKIQNIDGREHTVIKSIAYRTEIKDIDTKYGKITKEQLENAGKIQTSMNKDAYVIEESFIDKYKAMPRLAQTIPLKDIGFIITSTGLNKDSIVGESGCGSGGVSCFLAKIVKEIRSYDINDKHIDITKNNLKELGIENVTVIKASVYEPLDIEDNYFDVFILDVPEPKKALNVFDKVKVGGFVISYSPSISQNLEFVNSLPENVELVKTIEVLNRKWKLHKDIAKPEELEINHSGFMTLVRKLDHINN